MRGIVRKIGLEGGVWALVTDDGTVVELIDAPAELLVDGMRAEVTGTKKNADVTIGMVGAAVRVTKFEKID